MDSKSLPKIELHLHLDCSLRWKVVRRFDPAVTESFFEKNFKAPAKCLDLPDFLACAQQGIQYLQTADQLQAVTLDLLEQLKEEGVLYSEIRFAPYEHIRRGLSPEAVVEAVLTALEEGQHTSGIRAGLLLCTLRELPSGPSLHTAQLAVRYRDQGVVGFDIAGNEADFPVEPHVEAFRHARENGVPCIAHAGEARGAEGIWEVLRGYQVERLGHGVRCIEDERLVEYLVDRQIHLEVCPSSNIQTNVFDTIADHPVDRLFRAGISLGINTDSRTLTNTTLEREYDLLERQFGWGKKEFLQCNLQALEHAFLPEGEKDHFRAHLRQAYQ
ncbi:MAG: adenosine deaminase [Lewinellaceae bacterium]|nr:adenosine deaminase [Lewinellaceae bacterium]